MSSPITHLGIVVIGRNEGERLVRCLRSIDAGVPTVYVDSGSTDGSVGVAREHGAQVVELDMSVPFTAARARNSGLDALTSAHADVDLVQFVDADCELTPGWLGAGAEALRADPGLAGVMGRLREREPDRSVYNRLCDMEWDAEAGETDSLIGVAMLRTSSLKKVGAYDAGLIAGEEPDLAIRLRAEGWRLRRLARDMATHDANMTSFGQWWRRARRSGHSYAELAARHSDRPGRPRTRQTLSILAWGAVLPALAVLLAIPTLGLSLIAAALVVVVQWHRVARHERRRGARNARLYAAFVMLAKLPQALGVARYWLGRATGKRSRIIEHKAPGVRGVEGVGGGA